MQPIKILVFDDELSEIGKLYIQLLLKDFIVEATIDPTEITHRIRRMRPHIAVVNQEVRGFDAAEVCQLIKAEMNIPLILLLEKDSVALEYMGSCHADDVIYKPVDINELLRKIINLSVLKE